MKYKEALWVNYIGGQHHSDELVCCPKCKSKAMVRIMAGGHAYIRCTNEYCQLETSTYWHGSLCEKEAEKDAIQAWNSGVYRGHYTG